MSVLVLGMTVLPVSGRCRSDRSGIGGGVQPAGVRRKPETQLIEQQNLWGCDDCLRDTQQLALTPRKRPDASPLPLPDLRESSHLIPHDVSVSHLTIPMCVKRHIERCSDRK